MSQRKRGRGGPGLKHAASQVEEVEESSFTQTQTPSQVQRNLEKRSPGQVDQKVGEVLQYLLVKDQKKLPIKRADIMKNVVKEYKDIYPEIMNRTGKKLQHVYGLQLEEIDTKNHIYILVNRLQRVEGDNMRVDDNTGKLGLLTVILSLIFMKGNVTKESVIWETLRRLRLDLGYLEYTRIPHTEPVEYEFRWGPRAFKETSKINILKFVSKIQNKAPESWVTHYKEAMAESAATAANP
uniref:Non-structural maintenance of chromosomes element 3 homolog isoform X2 n=1 Tax=Geotrypetes seraphini TaxID=260995 RepID=A0A6P8PNZ2_GEOSA|nr:non-structural maintenance of chromosomes element 3 homolog isoform X2 [Geotrypetes seraphini]